MRMIVDDQVTGYRNAAWHKVDAQRVYRTTIAVLGGTWPRQAEVNWMCGVVPGEGHARKLSAMIGWQRCWVNVILP